MQTNRLLMLITLFAAVAVSANAQGRVEKLDPALDSIISSDAVVEKLSDAPEIGTREGPVWITQGNYLLYTDLPAKSILKWDPKTGAVSTFLADADADGMTLDAKRRLVWAGGKRIARLENNGTQTVVVSEYKGVPLNAPNDLTYKRDGALYFTDPGVYLMSADNTKILAPDIPAVYLFKDGKLSLLTTDILRVNGIAFTPDERHIYINSSFSMNIMKYDVLRDDTIANPKVFLAMNGDHQHPFPSTGFPDGMKVDQKGNVYCTGPEGIWIISPEGKHLGTIVGVNHPANLAFGGDDGKTLYITSRPGLYRVKVNVPGILP